MRPIAILNDYTRYQALPGNAYPESSASIVWAVGRAYWTSGSQALLGS